MNKNYIEKFTNHRMWKFCIGVYRVSKRSPRYDVEITRLSKEGGESVARLVVFKKDGNYESYIKEMVTDNYYWVPLSLLKEAEQFAMDFFNNNQSENNNGK